MSDPMTTLLGLRGNTSPDDLKRFGFECAGRWIRKEGSLNDAVTDVVREHRLNPEQTRRVVEFSNHAVFGHLFEKQGSDKAVDFPVADAKIVLAAFAKQPDRPVTTPIDSTCGHVQGSEGVRDFVSALFGTPSVEKTASANPFGELKRAWSSLTDTRNHISAELDHHVELAKEADRKFAAAFEQAVLSGDSTVAELSCAMHQVAGESAVKLAVLTATTPMIRKGSMTDERVGTAKTAARRANPAHPVLTGFAEARTLHAKTASLRTALADVDVQVARLRPLISKTAAPAWLSKALTGMRLAKNVTKDVVPTSIGGRSIRDVALEALQSERYLPGMPPNLMRAEEIGAKMDALRKAHTAPETMLEVTGLGKGVGTAAALMGGAATAHGIGNMMDAGDEARSKNKSLVRAMAENPDLSRLDPEAIRKAHNVIWKFGRDVAEDPTVTANWLRTNAARSDVGIDAMQVKQIAELQKTYGEGRASKGLLPSTIRTLALSAGLGD